MSIPHKTMIRAVISITKDHARYVNDKDVEAFIGEQTLYFENIFKRLNEQENEGLSSAEAHQAHLIVSHYHDAIAYERDHPDLYVSNPYRVAAIAQLRDTLKLIAADHEK